MGQNEATNLPISFPKKTTLMPYFQVSLLNPHSSGNDINCICFLPRISSSGLREESQGFHLRQGALPGSWGSLDPRGCRVGPSVEGGRHATLRLPCGGRFRETSTSWALFSLSLWELQLERGKRLCPSRRVSG